MAKKLKREQSFWGAFHSAWGKDSGEGERPASYDKKAWMYVQTKIQEYFLEKKEKGQ